MTRFLRWVIFGAGVSVLPLILVYTELRMRGQPISLEKVIGNGELLVIIWVLAASAFGELIGSSATRPNIKVVFGGLIFIVILISASFFASISEARAAKVLIDEQFVSMFSMILFVLSLVPCGVCILCS